MNLQRPFQIDQTRLEQLMRLDGRLSHIVVCYIYKPGGPARLAERASGTSAMIDRELKIDFCSSALLPARLHPLLLQQVNRPATARTCAMRDSTREA